MLSHMQQQEETEQAKDERSRKRVENREAKAEKVAQDSQRRSTRTAAGNTKTTEVAERPRAAKGKKSSASANKITKYMKKEDLEAKGGKESVTEALLEAAEEDVNPGDIGVQDLRSARQPELVTGGAMRSYQLEGLEWLKSLYENGLNGILADEMGLGKTLQTISFLAFLREQQSYGPFLIAAPLSTTSNWVDEFHRWTPTVPVVLYHGSKDQRAEIRSTKLKRPGSADFPVVVTSYEICMNDRKFLANFGWKFIIIDEGHRIKNLDCKLVRELQTYQSANRLLITGTPLQNNLTELWSLLHFLMPDIFDKLEAFESWFDFSEIKDKKGYHQIFTEERKSTLVASLHAILKPFLLRRVKADVEKTLPRKREYILYAPLTQMQRDLYQAILNGTSRNYLEEKVVERLSLSGTATPVSVRSRSVGLKRKALDQSGRNTPAKSAKTSRESTPGSLRGRFSKRKNYEEVSDAQYFRRLEDQTNSEISSDTSDVDEEEQARVATLELAKAIIRRKKLQNPIMQLRLCCDSPYNFFNPFLLEGDEDGEEGEPDETLVTTSGKMLLLDSLLPALFDDGHKVLIFSQFKTQLDLLQSYADMRGWPHCRIDGSVAQEDRHAQIKSFNQQTGKNATNLFLLSTRAGGQGINLASADTVILFDSDWNPQQDLQAQDRAHRIGQTRNVIVYRLATRGTVEQTLLETAEGKRRLEKLVIRKNGLREDSKRKPKDHDDLAELQRLLTRQDGEQFEVDEDSVVLSKRDLQILTDRSEAAYDRAEKGEDEGAAFKAVELRGDTGLLEGLKA